MSNEIGSETTTHVPLLKYEEEEESLVGLGGSREEGMADSDSLEGHIITVVRPSNNYSLPVLVRRPVFWLLVLISILLLICIILGALLSASNKHYTKTEKELKTAQDVCLTDGCLDAAHYMYNAINHSADPCNDFFEYSCGGWIKKEPIPDSKPFWGTFSFLWDQNLHAMKRLLTDEGLAQSKSSAIHLAKTFYDSCINLDRLDELKDDPLQKILKQLGGWSVSGNWSEKGFSLNETLKKVQLGFRASAFFSFYISADDKNSSRNIIKVNNYCLYSFKINPFLSN